jgi:glycosyltransferase involved in cell wall biosynthesis
MKKRISVVTPCYNEEENVAELYRQIKEVFTLLPDYDYEHIFIDNASNDNTVNIVKGICKQDLRVKLIVNARNFGHIRSPFYGLLQADGDAVILMVSDLQDPPTMIKDFVRKWEEGFKIILGVKVESEESASMFFIRRMYYNFISRISDIELTRNNTGFGLYDKQVIDILKEINDPYPYFRGLISDIGFESYKIPYKQPSRKRGITKNNFYTLYDMAMLGITNHTKIPLRLATMFGFGLSFLSLFVAFVYFFLKLIFWQHIPFGMAPLVIGMFFFASVQLFFIGMLGEYIGAVHTQVLKRPLVIEKERINFDNQYQNHLMTELLGSGTTS